MGSQFGFATGLSAVTRGEGGGLAPPGGRALVPQRRLPLMRKHSIGEASGDRFNLLERLNLVPFPRQQHFETRMALQGRLAQPVPSALCTELGLARPFHLQLHLSSPRPVGPEFVRFGAALPPCSLISEPQNLPPCSLISEPQKHAPGITRRQNTQRIPKRRALTDFRFANIQEVGPLMA